MTPNTDKATSAIKSVVRAANMLGAVAEHPLLPRNIAAKANEVWEQADIDSLIDEHSALLQVAEASKAMLSAFDTDKPVDCYAQRIATEELALALDELATIQGKGVQS